MNIILKDGRRELYQWDTGRQIQFDDSAVGQAHFANKLFGRSVDVDITDGVCLLHLSQGLAQCAGCGV